MPNYDMFRNIAKKPSFLCINSFAMPVFLLPDELLFPDPRLAEPDGILAVGGDFSPERILLAYRSGIFPWPAPDYELIWASPDPRSMLFPHEFMPSKSLRQSLRNRGFRVTADTAFERVIALCSHVQRSGNDGTWIIPEIVAAYTELHRQGFTHSVETWEGDRLVGGLYGVSLGGAFFGESMFHTSRDASKVAVAALVSLARRLNFDFIDGQLPAPHLQRLGFVTVSRIDYLLHLKKTLQKQTLQQKWTHLLPSDNPALLFT